MILAVLVNQDLLDSLGLQGLQVRQGQVVQLDQLDQMVQLVHQDQSDLLVPKETLGHLDPVDLPDPVDQREIKEMLVVLDQMEAVDLWDHQVL